jgi:hypothetical protein
MGQPQGNAGRRVLRTLAGLVSIALAMAICVGGWRCWRTFVPPDVDDQGSAEQLLLSMHSALWDDDLARYSSYLDPASGQSLRRLLAALGRVRAAREKAAEAAGSVFGHQEAAKVRNQSGPAWDGIWALFPPGKSYHWRQLTGLPVRHEQGETYSVVLPGSGDTLYLRQESGKWYAMPGADADGDISAQRQAMEGLQAWLDSLQRGYEDLQRRISGNRIQRADFDDECDRAISLAMIQALHRPQGRPGGP